MTSPPTTSGDGAATIAAYEALRTLVLTGAITNNPTGLNVLLQQGVVTWMTGRRTCSASAMPSSGTPAILVSNELHAGIVQVLANMALASRKLEASI